MNDLISGIIKGFIIGSVVVIIGVIALMYAAEEGWWGLFYILLIPVSVPVLIGVVALPLALLPRLVRPGFWHHRVPGNFYGNLEVFRRWYWPDDMKGRTKLGRRMYRIRRMNSARTWFVGGLFSVIVAFAVIALILTYSL